MFRSSTIFFILSLCVASVVCSPNCGPNAVYSSCASSCPLTCDNYKNPPEFCIQVCVERCKCDEGYVFNKNNICVLPCECENQ
ncbi:venom peptide SjAPI-2-like [Polistes fuscatus]|uniref:venom peptide SjAPI-2-like n=1 Tax=Polistes fuscatus TaxID=30207 RepID=UPI001CA9CD9C|nr:venom peptide SjAPI-2-like [Polistes fuscatus]